MNKRNLKVKKFQLHRETLRALTAGKSQLVKGGLQEESEALTRCSVDCTTDCPTADCGCT